MKIRPFRFQEGILTLALFLVVPKAEAKWTDFFSPRVNNREIVNLAEQWALQCFKIERANEECQRLLAMANQMKIESHLTQSCSAPLPLSHLLSTRSQVQRFISTLHKASNVLWDWPTDAVLELIRCVEQGKSPWKKMCKKFNNEYTYALQPECPVPSLGETLKIELNDKCDRIFINLPEHYGEGSFKRFTGVIEYKELRRGAQGKLKEEVLQKASKTRQAFEEGEFRSESNFLGSINSLPNKKRIGLPITYYADQHRVIQPRMYALGSVPYLDPMQGVQAISQLSRGLENLHEVGLVHSDLKPDNVMANGDVMNQDSVITDFGLGYSPERELKKGAGKPVQGTPGYMAPEQNFDAWAGKSKKEQAANAKKADVFAMAMVFLEKSWLNQEDSDLATTYLKYQTCNAELGTNVFTRQPSTQKYYECRHLLLDLRSELDKKKKNEPLRGVLLRAIHPDPQMRPTSKEFREDIDAALTSTLATRAADLLNQQIGPGLDSRFVNWSRKDLRKKMQHDRRSWFKRNNTYYVFPDLDPETGLRHLSIVYKPAVGSYKTIRLKSNPLDPYALRDELVRIEKEKGFLPIAGAI